MLLPIVERELRVASRRVSTYWTRFVAGLAVIVVWLILLGSAAGSPSQLGHRLFNALGVLGLGFSMLAGVFLTADCLSEEKREGTLGLLFLTDLKGYDVVLGKLAAASVHAFFGLLAIFPILGLPLMIGGVTGAEFWRLMLVLSVTLLFSLGLGIFVSSLKSDAKHAMSGALLLVILFAGILPALWWIQWILVKVAFLDCLLLPSPGYALLRAFDMTYRTKAGATEFWRSLGTILSLGLGAVGFAMFFLPRAWQQDAPIPKVPAPLLGRLRRWRQAKSPRGYVIALDENPYGWLVSRLDSSSTERNLLRILLPVWVTLLVVSIFSARHTEAFITAFFVAFGMHLALKAVIAMEASRRVCEDRQSGALELIVVTPLALPTILFGHWLGLCVLFKRPLLILVLVNATMIATVLLFGKRLHMDHKDQALFCELFVGGIVMLAADFVALTWVGMWSGLRAKRHHRAIFWSLLQVTGIPWCAIFLQVFMERGFRSAWGAAIAFACWFALGLVVDLVAGARAKRRLTRQFRSASTFAGS